MADTFDVFLSHNGNAKPAVRRLAEALRERGLRVWLDEWELVPGRPWQEALEEVIRTAASAAVLVGGDGLGPWEIREMRGCLAELVRRDLPVIPVLLPGAPAEPELPLFLAQLTWVDLRAGLSRVGLERLEWGITGRKPGDGQPPEADPPPAPSYAAAEDRELSEALERAYRSQAELESTGRDTGEVRQTILELRRQLREGGQLRPGDFLGDGRWQLLERIGQGGFASVFKAYDRRRRAVVAVKVLHGQYAQDRSRRERFFRGARQMARLRHPGFAALLEPECEDGGHLFFVMEYVPGGDLRQAVLAGRVTPREGLAIVREIGEALTFAHGEGVIHRDVKPANVLLGRDARPKLTDFDLVRAADTTGGTRTGMLGTFLYAAPEAMARAQEAAEAADVYGLGMTAIFVLHGADLPPDVLWEPAAFIAGLEATESCKRVLTKAVARQVEDRWESVEELCAALAAGLQEASAPSADADAGRPRVEASAPPSTVPPAVSAPAGGVGRTWVHQKSGIELVWVPGGEYVLGAEELPGLKQEIQNRAKPAHQVRLSPFWIGKFAVTHEQYARFLKARPEQRKPGEWDSKRFNAQEQPVVGVSWQEARTFCAWAGCELPSEAQWEAAARGTDQRHYPWGNEEPTAERACFGGSWGKDKPAPVGRHPAGAGPFGTQDQAGNVWEWCEDLFDETAYDGRDGQVDPVVRGDEGDDSVLRVVRGGAWGNPSRSLRAAIRFGDRARYRFRDLGFRVVFRSGPEP